MSLEKGLPYRISNGDLQVRAEQEIGGHAHVAQYQVGAPRTHAGESKHTILGLTQFVVMVGKDASNHLTSRRLVINDEDTFHGLEGIDGSPQWRGGDTAGCTQNVRHL